MAKTLTHCTDCGIIRDDTFKGNRCKPCHKEYQHNYYKSNTGQFKIKRQQREALKPKKKLTLDERTQRTKEQKSHYGKIKYRAKKSKMASVRPPIKHNIDRESFCDNATWACSDFYYLPMDSVADCPFQWFEASYWDKPEVDESPKTITSEVKHVLAKILKVLRR